MGYFDEYKCALCGARDCVHKRNDAPPDPDKLANPKCDDCYGTGSIRHQDTVSGAKTAVSIPCHCINKSYKRYIENRVKVPCSICGETRYCRHRPRTLMQYLQRFGKERAE